MSLFTWITKQDQEGGLALGRVQGYEVDDAYVNVFMAGDPEGAVGFFLPLIFKEAFVDQFEAFRRAQDNRP